MRSKMPVNFLVRLFLGIFFISSLQIYWKYLACNVLLNKSITQIFNWHDLFAISILGLILVFQFVNWVKLVKLADLSFVEPVMTMGYLIVDIYSFLVLHENITLIRILGTLLIMVGVWLIAGTKYNTLKTGSQI